MKYYFLGITALAFIMFSFKAPTEYIDIKAKPEQVTNNGKSIYNKVCTSCHQMTGAGIPGAFPPLAKSDYLNADVDRAIKVVINGITGPITVNGKKYNTPMTKQSLTDQQVADVLTYVYASWGNNKSVVTPEMVKKLR